MEYKDQGRFLMLLGVVLLFVGMVAAFLGPVEVYVFYLFGEGGRLHYEGFGFGSLVFGNIVVQIAGYYLIAALCLPLAYGHLRRRSWARPLGEALLWAWLVVGVPLAIVFVFMLFSVKELTPAVAALVLVMLALSYPLAPAVLLRFYRGDHVRRTFEAGETNQSWLERLPMPVLVLGLLFSFYALVLHIPLLFNGTFPLFGTWLSGLEGFVALDFAILSLAFLTWGIWRQRAWAWWALVAYVCLLTASALVTLLGTSLIEMVAAMNLPPMELEIVQGVPVQGIHLAAFVGLPLLLTLVALLLSRRHYQGNEALTPAGLGIR
jgi:hypothetical protein